MLLDLATFLGFFPSFEARLTELETTTPGYTANFFRRILYQTCGYTGLRGAPDEDDEGLRAYAQSLMAAHTLLVEEEQQDPIAGTVGVAGVSSANDSINFRGNSGEGKYPLNASQYGQELERLLDKYFTGGFSI